MKKHALIVGNHNIGADIRRQLQVSGHIVINAETVDPIGVCDTVFDEIIILSNEGVGDAFQLKVLNDISKMPSAAGARVHLMLESLTTLKIIRQNGFGGHIAEKLDVIPFNIKDEWARSIRLDHKPITLQSDYRAHLVIFGSDEVVENIAINAALKSHYPNYTRDTDLRTRITIIDNDIESIERRMLNAYPHLFDNSYYRCVDCKEQKVTRRHSPAYSGSREDFVDVEWEFVKADISDHVIQDKLLFWASDPKQLLTVVIADGDDSANLASAIALHQLLHEVLTPVYVWLKDYSLIDVIHHTEAVSHLIPIGMEDRGYDVSAPLVEMGKNINYIYSNCYDDNLGIESGRYDMPVVTVAIDDDVREARWQSLDMIKRMSSIYNAMSIETKLHSLGLTLDRIDQFYDLSSREINLFAEVEHNRWCVEELILGYRPCTDDESIKINKDIKLKKGYRNRRIHYDLRSYRDLRTDETGRNVNIYDLCLTACLPLIATYHNH